MSGGTPTRLEGRHLRLAYERLEVASDLSIEIPTGRITAIIGANACGKSTLLRALARLLKPKAGVVHLDGHDIHRLRTKEVARRLGMLPQTPSAPDGITVADLVARGRYPHQTWLSQWSREDDDAIAEAMQATGVAELAGRPVDELSGGQRQRVWIAMALAQGTEILLLDEPTTFLDLAHELEVLDLLVELNAQRGRTIVIVLHQLNQACRYAHHLIAMKSGTIVAQGTPGEVVTTELVRTVFDLDSHVLPDPASGTPMIVPAGRHSLTSTAVRAPADPPGSAAAAATPNQAPAFLSAPSREGNTS
ncbi:MAG: ABC transporter ATP-binding protein [Gaiellales bacterium]